MSLGLGVSAHTLLLICSDAWAVWEVIPSPVLLLWCLFLELLWESLQICEYRPEVDYLECYKLSHLSLFGLYSSTVLCIPYSMPLRLFPSQEWGVRLLSFSPGSIGVGWGDGRVEGIPRRRAVLKIQDTVLLKDILREGVIYSQQGLHAQGSKGSKRRMASSQQG